MPYTQNTEGTTQNGILEALTDLVQGAGRGVTYTDRSSTITAGGTAQPLMAANAARKGFSVQNNSTENLTISATGTASANSGIVIPPGALYEAPVNGIPTTAISIFGATTGSRFDAREW